MPTLTFIMTSENFQVQSFLRNRGYQMLDAASFLTPDFVVSPGGSDVTPRLYFEKKMPQTFSSPQNDLNEINGIMAARIMGIPQIGICKGFQLLHVLSGGTLDQHIEGHRGSPHIVHLDKGVNIQVTSSHHQAVPRMESKMYEEVYFSHDGVTEAIISPSRNWGGVQWHPEYHAATEENKNFFCSIIEKLVNKTGAK